jgi:hypothetical protein
VQHVGSSSEGTQERKGIGDEKKGRSRADHAEGASCLFR